MLKCLLVGSFLAQVCISSASEAKPDDFGILEWVHNAEGGYYNPKQDFRYEIPGDPTSVAGIFAKERIEKGETLCKVPWQRLLKSDDPTDEGQSLCCGTGYAVAREMRKAENSSAYAPYATYLNAQREGQLPSAWSKKGKALLQEILGGTPFEPVIPPIEPTEWLEYDWYKRCRGDPHNALAAKAALLVVQHSEDAIMIPAYDFYNHRNGKWLNTRTKTVVGTHHITKATRTIEPGTQLYISYNMCTECGGRRSGYGTAEIFRDYGFVESIPQRWHYMAEDYQFDLEENEYGELTVKWEKGSKVKDDIEQVKVWLRREVRRLRRIKNLNWNMTEGDTYGIPQSEWDTIWDFYNANIVAMTYAIVSLEEKRNEEQTCSLEDYFKGGVCSNAIDIGSHYDALNYEIDDLDYLANTCDNDEIMDFEDYEVVDLQKTHYQLLKFMIQPDENDICMNLDSIVQICSNYRPQYHEYMVHAAARYVDTVRRVIFIGGGDSMLLHEALKYPTLELVVGLELDQVVARKSFKYFHTQPHFDDDRVEWWFGDATKSLLLLPKDYWQSFDLVLVDLSETVMSLSVTSELDVFDALALLLNKDGVMVKNEQYFEQFSKIFDHTVQLYYESPTICDQCMSMGSNKADFLHDTPKDHGVETLLYEPLVTDDYRFDYMHDYRKNDAGEQGKCGELKIPAEPEEQGTTAGIAEIVEAENTSVPLDNKNIAELMQAAVRKEGFTQVTNPSYDNGLILIVMEEGYIVARLWPEHKYCGFDINLWGSFHKMKSLRATLVEAVGSKSVSSYRIVVGGMYGAKTWKEDQKVIGPHIVQARNCEEKETKHGPSMDQEIMRAAMTESVKLVHSTELIVAVLCGSDDSKECFSVDVLGAHSNVNKVVPLWSCSGLEDDEDPSENAAKMYDCEKRMVSQLKKAFGQRNSKIDMFVVDSSVSYPMLQIFNSILSGPGYRREWLQEHHVFMAISTNPSEETWRKHFLDRYRKQHEQDPVARAEFLMQAGDSRIELGIVSCGDDLVAYNLETEESKLREHFTKAGMDVNVELRTIHGGLYQYIDDFDEVRRFLQSDYDARPGQEQYSQQQPLGSQHIFQVVPKKDSGVVNLTPQRLDDALLQALAKINCKVSGHYHVGGIGDGVLIAQTCDIGNAILVWDGREQVDLNLFTFQETEGDPEKFVTTFMSNASGGNTLDIGLRDDMPRGIGRVVNFKSHLVESE